MCGICGYVGRATAHLLNAMTGRLVHRGPDGGAMKSFPSEPGLPAAGLGHRRLGIIDRHPRGAQPMSDANDRYWITYCGELYHCRPLRHEVQVRRLTRASSSGHEDNALHIWALLTLSMWQQTCLDGDHELDAVVLEEPRLMISGLGKRTLILRSARC
jgi:hypothetical protein